MLKCRDDRYILSRSMRRRNGYELDSKNKIDKESQVPNIKIKEVSRKVSRLQN